MTHQRQPRPATAGRYSGGLGPGGAAGVAALTGVWQGGALSIPMIMVRQETPGGAGVSSIYGATFSSAGLIAWAVTGGTAALVGYGGVLWVRRAVGALGMLTRLAFPRAISPVPGG